MSIPAESITNCDTNTFFNGWFSYRDDLIEEIATVISLKRVLLHCGQRT